MHALASASLKNLSDVPHDISYSSWAFASLEMRDQTLRDAISAQSLRLITQFAPTNCTNSALAMATLQFCHTPLLASISAASLRTITEFFAKDLVHISRAMAQIVYLD